MTHGKKMEMYGRILALQDIMLYAQKEINKLKKQLQEVEDGSSKASDNRSR